MKIVKIIALVAAACGIVVSASCCSKSSAPTPPVYVPATK